MITTTYMGATERAALDRLIREFGAEVKILRIAPMALHSTAAADTRPMSVNEARLLRRIHRGEDVRRSMSRVDRELTLPSLTRRGLADATSAAHVGAHDLCAAPAGRGPSMTPGASTLDRTRPQRTRSGGARDPGRTTPRETAQRGGTA